MRQIGIGSESDSTVSCPEGRPTTGSGQMSEEVSPKRVGLTEDQAQKVLDYVSDRLNGADNATAERLLDGFVDRLRGLNNVASVKRLIEVGDENTLRHLGGVEGAKGMIYLVEKIGRE